MLCAIFMRLTVTILFFSLGYFASSQSILPINDTCGRFGIACYNSGLPQRSILQTIYLVNNLKKTQLLTWMNSEISENQVHGYVGLYFMKRNGLTLSQEEIGLMKKIKHLKSPVDFCQDAKYGKEKISTLLTRKMISSYYSWYVSHGYKDFFK